LSDLTYMTYMTYMTYDFSVFKLNYRTPGNGGRVFSRHASESLSRMRIANLIEAGACLVNGSVGRRLSHSDGRFGSRYPFDDGAPTAMSPEPIPLEVIHEDEHVIVVVKQPECSCIQTMSVKTGTLA